MIIILHLQTTLFIETICLTVVIYIKVTHPYLCLDLQLPHNFNLQNNRIIPTYKQDTKNVLE